MSHKINPMYADNVEQTHDLFDATLTHLSLKTSAQFPLNDSNHGLVKSQNKLKQNKVKADYRKFVGLHYI